MCNYNHVFFHTICKYDSCNCKKNPRDQLRWFLSNDVGEKKNLHNALTQKMCFSKTIKTKKNCTLPPLNNTTILIIHAIAIKDYYFKIVLFEFIIIATFFSLALLYQKGEKKVSRRVPIKINNSWLHILIVP